MDFAGLHTGKGEGLRPESVLPDRRNFQSPFQGHSAASNGASTRAGREFANGTLRMPITTGAQDNTRNPAQTPKAADGPGASTTPESHCPPSVRVPSTARTGRTASATVRLPAAANPRAARASNADFRASGRQSPVHPSKTAPANPSGFAANTTASMAIPEDEGASEAGFARSLEASATIRLSPFCSPRAFPATVPTLQATNASISRRAEAPQCGGRERQTTESPVSTASPASVSRARRWFSGERFQPFASPAMAPKTRAAPLMNVPSTGPILRSWAAFSNGDPVIFPAFTPCFLTFRPNDPRRFMSSPTLPSSTPVPSAPASEAPFDLLTWFELNRNRILIGVGAICAVVIALMVVRARRQAEDRSAAISLFNLVPPTGPGETPAALDPQKLLQLTQQYSGTPSATQARLLAAGQLFTEGKFAEAQAQFAALDESQAEGPFQGIALLGVATSLDAQNKSTEAVAAYDRVISLFPNTGPAQQARIAKARLIQGTQPAQALAALDDVLKNEYAFGYQEIAGAARSRLLAQHPELDLPLVSTNQTRVSIPTNSPAAPAAAK